MTASDLSFACAKCITICIPTSIGSLLTHLSLILLPLTLRTSHISFFQVHMNNNLIMHFLNEKQREFLPLFLCIDSLLWDFSKARCSNLACLLGITVWCELKGTEKRFCVPTEFILNTKLQSEHIQGDPQICPLPQDRITSIKSQGCAHSFETYCSNHPSLQILGFNGQHHGPQAVSLFPLHEF